MQRRVGGSRSSTISRGARGCASRKRSTSSSSSASRIVDLVVAFRGRGTNRRHSSGSACSCRQRLPKSFFPANTPKADPAAVARDRSGLHSRAPARKCAAPHLFQGCSIRPAAVVAEATRNARSKPILRSAWRSSSEPPSVVNQSPRTAPPRDVKNVLQTERESRYTLSLKGRLSWDFNYV